MADAEMAATNHRLSTDQTHSTFEMKAIEGSEPALGHMMSSQDPDNPHNWPIYRRIYASAVSMAFVFVVTNGATSYTAGITQVMNRFNVSMTVAILPFTLYFLGIIFAPIVTPHLSELFGRSKVYFATFPIFALFILGASLSRNFAGLTICRLLAGVFGGPSLVLIEGTFADIWHAHNTVSYYSVLALASYIGAATGPLIGGFVAATKGWRWTQWTTLMLALAALLFGIGLPETYQREILRRRAKRRGLPALNLAPARSGVTLVEMFRATVLTPFKMFFIEPVVIVITLYLGFNFGIIFSFFISVPVVLHLTYNFSVQHAGLAFISAIVGALLAAFTAVIIDRLAVPRVTKKNLSPLVAIEYRLVPAMIGGIFITTSLFWIAWTASPKFMSPVPISGTGLYVWGNMLVLISMISYLFDAYPPLGTLSALSAAACFRLAMAAIFPLFIIQAIVNLTGAWAYSLFGFLSAAMLPIPFILFKWGPNLRARSKYSEKHDDDARLI